MVCGGMSHSVQAIRAQRSFERACLVAPIVCIINFMRCREGILSIKMGCAWIIPDRAWEIQRPQRAAWWFNPRTVIDAREHGSTNCVVHPPRLRRVALYPVLLGNQSN